MASLGVGLLAALIALFLSLMTIAVGWIFYRPLLGGTLLAVGIAGVVGIFMWIRSRRAAAAGRFREDPKTVGGNPA
jgi:hypothetical protein